MNEGNQSKDQPDFTGLHLLLTSVKHPVTFKSHFKPTERSFFTVFALLLQAVKHAS